MSLVGHRYIQASEPPMPPSGGYEWFDTSTGQLYIRNYTNNMWVAIGDSGVTHFGSVPLTGATMTGNLAGVTGWSPAANPDFQGSAKRDGIELATKGDISTLRRELMAKFNQMSAEAMSALSGSSGALHNIAIRYGVTAALANTTFAIALPQYDGGTGDTAKKTEVLFHGAWPQEAEIIGGEGQDAIQITLQTEATMTYLVRSGYASGANWGAPVKAGWLVIAVR